MIVTCTRCQSKFRVADEKIGPRGVKVRCSRCQNVFPVRRETTGEAALAPPAQMPPSQLPPPLPRPSGQGGVDLDLESGAPAPAAGPDPFANAAGPREPDPFAPAAAAPGAPPDPFGHPAASQDPFGSTGLADPFVASVVPRDGPGGGSAATDLSDLLGGSPPAPEPAPAPAEARSDTPFGSIGEEGLSLEDRTTPPPVHTGGQGDPFGGADPFGRDGASFGELDLGGPAQAASPAPAAPAFAEAGFASPEVAAPRAARPPPARHAPEPAPAEAADLSDRIRRRRGARLRAVAVNAVSLAVLVLATLAIVVIWRGDAPVDARALRPSAVLTALGRGPAGPVAAADVSNGLYERARGAPVLFVRGRVVSRAAAPVGPVRVAVDVVRDGTVIAHGEALAGALPTPEELYDADDAAALDLLATSLRARAARTIPPGESVPFLVAIAEYPADLSGAALRVVVGPEERSGK